MDFITRTLIIYEVFESLNIFLKTKTDRSLMTMFTLDEIDIRTVDIFFCC